MVTEATPILIPVRWEPRGLERAIWVVTGLALFVVLFGVYTNMSLEGDTITIGFDDLVIAIITLNALWLIHQYLHGFAMTRSCGRPSYRMAWIGRVIPVARCSSPGTLFSRGQFALIAILPFLVVALVGGVVVAVLPGKSALPLALAVHGALCVRDLWSIGVAWRQPAGTRFELADGGLVLHMASNETGAA